jgi:hypothetical protein
MTTPGSVKRLVTRGTGRGDPLSSTGKRPTQGPATFLHGALARPEPQTHALPVRCRAPGLLGPRLTPVGLSVPLPRARLSRSL